ncbi:hypothetical protein [Natrinema sp. H-ect4]|uniref:hypothetical protein n=1 Tax=Natrinema sp. H-ect4 TaxID=3242699 RepID=UPI0035A86980
MEYDSQNIAARKDNAVAILREANEEKWEELAEETTLTKRQIAMWELAIVFDQKNAHIAREYDVRVTTVARHCERVREKHKETEKKVQQLENTIEYLNGASSTDA